jgi:uncharacterized membrane protein (UPF0182 family)
VYASPGASDAASSYPRLIRVAMLYNDKVGYGPTVSQALDGIFGSGAGATAADPGPIDGLPGAKPPTDGEQKAQAVEIPTPPVAVVPPGGLNLSATKAAALQEVQTALGAVREAQRSGNFAQYGAALQRLDEAMGKFDSAK